MRIALLILSLIVSATGAVAQFGNEWIDYSRQYWRFPVVNDGLARISYDQLIAAGFPVGAVEANTVKIFGRGKEQFIRVVDGGDGQLNPGDYIEFFVQKNDGWLDAFVYDEAIHQANSNYSLFNDTARYFLSYGGNPGLRTANYVATNPPEALTPLPYVRATQRLDLTAEYLLGDQDINGIALPWYEEAEGWFDTRFAKGQSRSHTVQHPQMYTGVGAPDVRFTAISASASDAVGFYNHHLQVGYGNPLNVVADTIYDGYKLHRFTFNVPVGQLTGNSTVVTHRSIDDLNVASDWHAVGSIAVTYPRNAQFPTGAVHRFTVENLYNANEVRLEFGFGGNAPRLFIWGDGLQREIPVVAIDGGYRALVPLPTGSQPLELLLLDDAAAQPTAPLRPVTSSGFFTHYAANPIDSAFLLITHPQLEAAALNYAFHRQNQGLDALVIDVEELYMQYAAGVWKHPLAVRRFCDHLLTTWPSKPSHLFLVGKSIFEMKIGPTVGARNNPTHYANNLVPSWGYPTSDIAFTSGLNGTLAEMAIPTGRLAAPDQETVLSYLNKVVEFEAQAPAPWMKRVLHFGGGGTANEQVQFANYLNNYATMVRDTCFGGDVHSFFKTTTDPIQLNLSDSISFLINDGVSLMTFFGHASSTGFDVNIDDPSSYNNQGKYPLLIGNSCYTGNMHQTNNFSASEVFTLAPQAGVIGFIAKGDLGAPLQLNLWTSNFYRHLFQLSYGKSIGQCMQATVQSFQSATMNLLTRNTALTFALHGDPALVLNAWEKPDYVVRDQDVVFEPREVSAELETFTVKVAVQNQGKAINAPVSVELIRHFPNGTDTSLVLEMPPVLFRDTAVFELTLDPVNGVGLNRFDVFVDFPVNAISELEDVSNNRVFSKELFITDGSLTPIFPFNFAIQPTNEVVLRASTGDPLAPERAYIIQIDTTDLFNSNALLSTTLTGSGGVFEWSPPLTAESDRVYYWRSSSIPPLGGDYTWKLHSFQYVPEERGFGQAHFYQFRNNAYTRILWNEPNRSYDFESGEKTLKVTVYGDPANSFEANATRYQIDLEVMDYAGCGNTPSIYVAVIDPVTLAPWESNYNNQHPENEFGNNMSCANGRGRPEKYFVFRQNDAAEMAGLYNLLNTGVPDGHYLLAYTWQHVDYADWAANAPGLADLFGDLGSEQIGSGEDGMPFIFFARKGSPATAMELYGTAPNALIELETQLVGSFGVGSNLSPRFGPAPAWESLTWAFADEPSDSTQVRVFGRGLTAGWSDVLLGDFPSTANGWLQLGESVDAVAYPLLRLQSELRDGEDQTPAQIARWQLRSGHAPEAALNARGGFYFPNDTVQQGEPLAVAVAIANIGEFAMDSLLVRYSVSGPGNPLVEVPYSRQDSLRVGAVFIDTVYVPTGGLRGENRLRIEVNPRNAAGIPDQLEQTHVNNVAELRFFVLEDRINPLLDVTFDGRHILNGDLVSVRPQIRIALNDENEFLLLDSQADTASFKVFLTWPDGMQRPVHFAQGQEMTFYPATDATNRSRIEYHPQLIEDGGYRLTVQAQDKSGNASGSLDYRIDFEVYSKPTITEVLNYPNPFSTRTSFVFTITGTEPPDEMLIRIMTVAGRVVREIRSDELGPLNVGRNQSAFWWDGTDQFGDRLANGIYLYSVQARLRGEVLEYRSTSASPYFNNGIGKMYLLR